MKRKLLLLIAIVPAIVLGLLVWRYSVNIPFWDQWDTPGALLWEKTLGKLTLSQWMHQHTESRPVFPKLLFVTLADLTNWNNRAEMLVTFLVACCVSANIYYLSRQTFPNKIKHFICFILANLLIFSPIQQENWMWGFQSITFSSIFAITTSFVVIFAPTPWLLKLIVSLTLSVIATFSFANGILCWIIILPALLFKLTQNNIKKIWAIFPWLLVFTISIAIYFHEFTSHPEASSLTDVFFKPFSAIAYYLALIGTPIVPHDLSSSQIVGGVILLAFLYFCFFIWTKRQNKVLVERVLPWILIGLYVLFSAALITAGRIGFGIDTASSQRYITFSTYLIVATIYLLTVFLSQMQQKKLKKIIVAILLIAFLITYKDNYFTGLKSITRVHYQRVYGKACVLTFDLIRDEECISQRIYPHPGIWEERARNINSIGLLQPSIAQNINWQSSAQEPANTPGRYGNFAKLTQNDDGSYRASGWVWALSSQPSFDAIILTVQGDDSKAPQAFAIADLQVDSDDLFALFVRSPNIKLNWHKDLTPEEIPPPGSIITAWAFDTDDVKAYPLNGVATVNGPKTNALSYN